MSFEEKPSRRFTSENSTPFPSQTLLVEIFEPSTPNRPHRDEVPRRRSWVADIATLNCTNCQKPFGLLLRRHHCRRCGRIFCYDCSNNRLTNLRGPNDENHYRLCDNCIDELVDNEQAIDIPANRCGLIFASYRRVAAVSPADWSPTLPPAIISENLINFDDDEIIVTPSPEPNNSRSTNTFPFSGPMVSPGSTPSNDNLFTRLAAAARTLPTRLRSNSLSNNDSKKISKENNFEYCPVCSINLSRWKSPRVIEEHIENCLLKTEHCGSVLGNRYTVHRWSSKGEIRECLICYEEFITDDKVAVLNCLCQYHERCIEAWFERGKICPYHAG